MNRQCRPPCLSSAMQQSCHLRLAATPDLGNISRVEYAHDPVPKPPSFFVVEDVPFPRRDCQISHLHQRYAIRLRPRDTDLPYRSTLDATHESRFWKSGLKASKALLRLFADDRSITDIVVGKGVTMARLAQRELRPGFEHRFCKATSYMYPFCDEERTKLLASSMVMMFLFDGEKLVCRLWKPRFANQRLQTKARRRPTVL